MKIKICPICGKRFEAVGQQKICSDECRKEQARRKTSEYVLKIGKITLQKKVCPVCGEKFETYKTRQILCGKKSCKEKNEESYRKANKQTINNRRKNRYENNKEAEKLYSKMRYENNKKIKN